MTFSLEFAWNDKIDVRFPFGNWIFNNLIHLYYILAFPHSRACRFSATQVDTNMKNSKEFITAIKRNESNNNTRTKNVDRTYLIIIKQLVSEFREWVCQARYVRQKREMRLKYMNIIRFYLWAYESKQTAAKINRMDMIGTMICFYI